MDSDKYQQVLDDSVKQSKTLKDFNFERVLSISNDYKLIYILGHLK